MFVVPNVAKNLKQMISAKTMLTRLQSLNQQKLETMVQEIVLSDQKRLKEQKISEWERGLIYDGVGKREYQDAEYAIFKQQINPLADGYVDLMLSHETARSLFVIATEKRKFQFNMRDRYNLIGKYTPEILGINKEYFNKRQENIYRYVLIQDIQKILNA
jgi:hypothetical protein